MSSEQPVTPGKKPDASIKDSLAALRSILMIDTPTKSLLDRPHPSVATQNSRYEERRQQREEIERLKSTANDLKSRVAEANDQVTKESRIRTSLETTYNALNKHKRELSLQLELVTKSRETLEQQLDEVKKTLRKERTEVAQERVQWKPSMERLQREKQRHTVQYRSLENRCRIAERNVKDLEKQLEELKKGRNVDSPPAQADAASEASVKAMLDKAADARRRAEEVASKSVAELAAIKRRHHKSLESLLNKQSKIKEQLQKSEEDRKKLEERLKEQTLQEGESVDLSQELEMLRQKVQELESQKPKQSNAEMQVDIQATTQDVEDTVAVGGNDDGIAQSIIQLDDFIKHAVDNDSNGQQLEVVQQLARIAQAVKVDMNRLIAAKEDAEGYLRIAKVADEKSSFELASSRENLREALEELKESKEELATLRLDQRALQEEYELLGKRIMESDNADGNISAKRQKTDKCDLSV